MRSKIQALLLSLTLVGMSPFIAGCEMSCDSSDNSVEDAIDEVGDEIEDVVDSAKEE